MESIHITLSESDIDLLERRAGEMKMSKAAYIRFLIAEHENTLPSSLKNKKIINEFSRLYSLIKSSLVTGSIEEVEKIAIYEELKSLQKYLYENLK